MSPIVVLATQPLVFIPDEMEEDDNDDRLE
jgi:hypothetical protein